MELLERHFDIALETPDGVKKLRELILMLAIQGKLVLQNSNEEPTKVLLKGIDKEKNKLIKAGEMKDRDPLPPIKVQEQLFDIPSSWEWVRLGAVITLLGDGIHGTPVYNNTGEYYFINGNNLADGKIEIKENTKSISAEEYHKHKKKLTARTVLVSINGTIGNVAFYDNEKVILGKSACYFNLFDKIDKLFIKKLINSKYFMDYAFSSATGSTIKNVSLKAMREFVFPLPPLAEQHRIVAKIDQLMALCDKLESERNERRNKRLAIHTAAINRLLSAPDTSAFNKSWNFITKNFSELYSVPENVEELKKAILQLAVMGKLVPQDPKDQPASELLREIEAEKKRLVQEGKGRNLEILPEIKPDEIPFDLPHSWEWVRLGDVGETNIGLTYSPADISNIGIPVLRSNNVQNGKLDLSDLVRVNKDVKSSVIVNEGDLLICARNGSKALVGKTAQITGLSEKMAFGAFMAIFRSRINNYVLYFINSPLFRRMIDEVNTMTINQITQNNLKTTIFPLPPLAEQKRIVAKIDQLMSLCNSLNLQLQNSTDKQTAILNSVLSRI
jgi:type I restriction enzyme S subunit